MRPHFRIESKKTDGVALRTATHSTSAPSGGSRNIRMMLRVTVPAPLRELAGSTIDAITIRTAGLRQDGSSIR